MANVFSKVQVAVKKKFSPKYRQEQIDVVTQLVTGKKVLDLAETALEVATTSLTSAEAELEKKQEAHAKAVVALESANISKNLRRKDFDTVVEILK